MKYNSDNGCVEMSVRELCELVFTRGSIDTCAHRADKGSVFERGALGTRIHKKLQSKNENYHSEVELTNTSAYNGVYYYVTGRADGIICNDGKYTVDEIKTVSDRAFSEGVSGIHTAQLFCYAYFFCRKKELDGVNTRMTYYNIDDGEIMYSDRFMTVSELRCYYIDMIKEVSFYGEQLQQTSIVRMPTCVNPIFPYPSLREGQSKMIKECYLDIKHGTRLFCQAPTGIGKTISVLYPTVKTLGEGFSDKIFYLTSKQSIRREALSAAKKMREQGALLRTCVIYAKEQICMCPKEKRKKGRLNQSCRPDVCIYAEGYYDKRKLAIAEMLNFQSEFDRESILVAARKYRICPYELSLDLSELCDIIICDYNYVFSPAVYFRRYFDGDSGKGKYIFLVDEAHNLPTRARDIYSSKLCKKDFLYLYSIVCNSGDTQYKTLRLCCEDLIGYFDGIKNKCRDSMELDSASVPYGYMLSRTSPDDLYEKLKKFSEKCETWQKFNEDSPVYEDVDALLSSVREFKLTCEHYSEGYVTLYNVYGEDASVLLYCLDPSNMLSVCLDRSVASVFFSATLTPAEYFADILGGGKNAVSVSFPSPFPSENLCIAAVDSISTRFSDREKSYPRIVSCIAATLSGKAGNYIAFFPSYKYMEDVYKLFVRKYPKVRAIIQSKGMSDRERTEFTDFFKDDDNRLRIGFCVLGGMFSEGVDLPGRRLIGAVVVGVGLPGISDEGNIIRDYYNEKNSLGYEYAYTYPGFNNVLQAIGRVIRRSDDKGIAVLIDDRYADPKYVSLFPDNFKGIKYAGNSASLAEIARRFWKEKK